MIPWPIIITAIFSIGIMYFLYTFYKTVFKIISTVMGVLFLALGVLTFLIIQDVKEMREHAADPKLFILMQGDTVLSAVKVSSAEPEILEKNESVALAGRLKAGQYDAALGNNYQMYIYQAELLERDKVSMEVQGQKLEHKALLAILDSGDQNLKAFIFVNIINEYNQGGKLVSAFRSGYVKVYPESITFKAVRKIPDSAFAYALYIIKR